MRKAEAQGINAAQMVTAVAVGGLLALGVELLMLLAGSAAVSNGVLREEAAPFPSDEERLVWEALCGLEESYRLPLYLYYFQELSAQEIGKALHLRPGTVRMRLSRGREKLREVLKGVFSDE